MTAVEITVMLSTDNEDWIKGWVAAFAGCIRVEELPNGAKVIHIRPGGAARLV